MKPEPIRLKDRFMKISLLLGIAFSLCGCVTQQTTYDRQGNVTDEKYIIHRPIKNFIENVEVE